MNNHINSCDHHFVVPKTVIDVAREQARIEEVEAGEGNFMSGRQGQYEWEVTGGAIKWWARWGEQGEASLFALYYPRYRDDSEEVDICLEIYQPTPRMEGDDRCPWYSMPAEKRLPIALRAFWTLVIRGALNAIGESISTEN